MFRIVNDMVPSPAFLLICDNRHCANLFHIPITGENGQVLDQAEVQKQQNEFLARAQADGWMINLSEQLCPGHFNRLKEAVQKQVDGQKRVEVVDPLKWPSNRKLIRLT